MLELATDDGELSDLTAILHVMRAELHGELEVLLPALLIVVGEVLDGLVPFDGQLVIVDHALVELVADVQIERGEDESRVEKRAYSLPLGESAQLCQHE